MSDSVSHYPSSARPQYSFYRKTPVRSIGSEQNFYDLVFNNNESNMDQDAIEYMGVCESFAMLKSHTDSLASAFSQSGLRKGGCCPCWYLKLPGGSILFVGTKPNRRSH